MTSELIPLTFHKIVQSSHYTLLILGTDSKKFAIYADSRVGEEIQIHLTNPQKPRPFTHDLIGSIFKGFTITPLQIVISDLEDTIYFARLFLEQKQGDNSHIVEMDARPSDCITLALLHNIPIFCKKEIFEKTLPIEE